MPEVIAGKYRLDEQIGSGAWGDVYRGENVLLKKVIAVKVLHRHLVKHEDKVVRFFREARAAAALKDPGICPVYDVGITDDGLPFYVMDFVSGRTLATIIDAEKKLEPGKAIELCTKVCSAMAVAHQAGIIHRDLTANNIMIKADGEPVLLDFGLAKFTSESVEASSLTESGTVLGSPAYMSPEQCMGQKLDQRSDIYSLGCVLYEMLCGQTPFHSATNLATMHGHVSERVPPIDPAIVVPAHVSDALMRSLSKQPNDRQQSMTEFAEELINPVRKRKPWAKRINKKVVIIAAAIAGVFLLAETGWTAFMHYQDQQRMVERKKALEMQQQKASLEQEADQKFSYFRNEFQQHQYVQARVAMDRLVVLCADDRVPAEKAARMLALVGNTYQVLSDDDRAIKAAKVAIKRLNQFCKPTAKQLIEEEISLANMLLQQASGVERNQTDWALAPRLYEADELVTKLDNDLQGQPGLDRQRYMVMGQRAGVFLLRRRYKQGVELGEKLLPYIDKTSEYDFEAGSILACIGQCYFYTGRPDLGKVMYQKDMQRTMSTGKPGAWGPSQVIASLGNTYGGIGDYKTSVQYLKLALTPYKNEKGFSPYKKDIQRFLAFASLKYGDPTEGYKAYKAQLRASLQHSQGILHQAISPFEQETWRNNLTNLYVAPIQMDTSNLTSMLDLPRIEHLCLAGTHLTDKQIASLGRLENLKGLFIAVTDITDNFADCLKQFPNLEYLDISVTPVGPRTAKAIAQLKHLKRLDASCTQFKDAEMPALSRSSCLQHITLGESGIYDEGIANLGNSRSLEELDLRQMESITDRGIAPLAKMPKLARLELYRNCVQGPGMSGLKNLKQFYCCTPHMEPNFSALNNLEHLKTLWACDMAFTDDMAACLAKNPDLEDVNLACTDVTDKTLELLPKLPHLVRLNVNHINMTEAGLASIAKCTNLEELHISQNHLKSLAPLAGLRKLRIVATTDNPIGDSDVEWLSTLPQIQMVLLDRTPVSAGALSKLAPLTTLNKISVSEIVLPADVVKSLLFYPNGKKRLVRASTDLITGNRNLIPGFPKRAANQ